MRLFSGDDWLATFLPRTLAGLAMWLLMFMLGAALSAAVLLAVYQPRVSSLKEQVESLRDDLKRSEDRLKQLQSSSGSSSASGAPATSAAATDLAKLLEKVGPSIATIEGKDEEGAPTSGSGFVVNAEAGEAWVLTNHHLVAGAVANEEPVRVRVGTVDQHADVFVSDPDRDLAIIVVKAGGLPFLSIVRSTDPAVGAQVWAVGASAGRLGATGIPARLLEVGPDALLTDAGIPSAMTGGPLVLQDGRVVGVLSVRYAPRGSTPSNNWAVPVRLACRKVLRCPS